MIDQRLLHEWHHGCRSGCWVALEILRAVAVACCPGILASFSKRKMERQPRDDFAFFTLGQSTQDERLIRFTRKKAWKAGKTDCNKMQNKELKSVQVYVQWFRNPHHQQSNKPMHAIFTVTRIQIIQRDLPNIRRPQYTPNQTFCCYQVKSPRRQRVHRAKRRERRAWKQTEPS